MPNHSLRLYFDRLDAPGEAGDTLSARPRILYAARGSVTAGDATLAEDEGGYFPAPTAMTPGDGGAIVWRWELAGRDEQPELASGTGVASRLAMEVEVDAAPLADDGHILFRCDSVAFPPGACAYTHVHQGPGIRCLRDGTIRIDSEGASHAYGPGDPWFEAGPEPVFAQADMETPSRFIRVMILPPGLKGQSSVRYIKDEDLDKPKLQTYRGYVDEVITL